MLVDLQASKQTITSTSATRRLQQENKAAAFQYRFKMDGHGQGQGFRLGLGADRKKDTSLKQLTSVCPGRELQVCNNMCNTVANP
jgi:hypothetical protein